MTNLDVLRAVQHAWPGYCWPFANSNGNGYSLGSSPSPPGASMNEAKAITSESISVNSNEGRRPRSHSRGYHRTSYEDQLLRMTSTPTSSQSRTKGTCGIKSERLSPEPINSVEKHGTISRHHAATHHISTPSPETSPKSPPSNTRTPSSLMGTPPHPGFTPPMTLPPGCFSPTGLTNLGAMPAITGAGPNMSTLNRQTNFVEPSMPRNCSDLMRSMAAKYNSNTNTNNNFEFFQKPVQRQSVHSLISASNGFQHNNDLNPSSLQNANPVNRNSTSGDFMTNGQKSPLALLRANLSHNSLAIGKSDPLSSLSHTQVLLDMVRNASGNQSQQQRIAESENIDVEQIQSPTPSLSSSLKRPADSSCPLDLSSSVSAKRLKTYETSNDNYSQPSEIINGGVLSVMNSKFTEQKTQSNAVSPSALSKPADYILNWTVDDVQDFVKSIDLCAEYADVFREQRIDGWCLSLLTESHLTSSLKMKLGPALKLKSILSTKKIHSEPHSNIFYSSNTGPNNVNSLEKSDDLRSNRCQSTPTPEKPKSPGNSQTDRGLYYHSCSPTLLIETSSPTPSDK